VRFGTNRPRYALPWPGGPGREVAASRRFQEDVERLVVHCACWRFETVRKRGAESNRREKRHGPKEFDHHRGTGDFTTTGPPCAAGTFLDTYRAVAGLAGSTLNMHWRTSLPRPCTPAPTASGTFNMQKHIRLVALPPGTDNTDLVSLQGGTGAYVGPTGHGLDSGANEDGHISGYLVQP
jgi:hypothetical protein